MQNQTEFGAQFLHQNLASPPSPVSQTDISPSLPAVSLALAFSTTLRKPSSVLTIACQHLTFLFLVFSKFYKFAKVIFKKYKHNTISCSRSAPVVSRKCQSTQDGTKQSFLQLRMRAEIKVILVRIYFQLVSMK